MTKEELLAKLKASFGNTKHTLSERTIDAYVVNTMLPFLPEDATKLDDFVKGHVASLQSIEGQKRNEVKLAVEDYEKANPKAAEKEVEVEIEVRKDTPKVENTQSEELKKIQEELNRLAEKSDAQDAEKRKLQLIGDAKALLAEKGATDKFSLEYTEQLLSVGAETTAEALAQDWEQRYNKFYSDARSGGYSPMGGGDSGKTQTSKEALASFKQTMQDKGKIPTA